MKTACLCLESRFPSERNWESRNPLTVSVCNEPHSCREIYSTYDFIHHHPNPPLYFVVCFP